MSAIAYAAVAGGGAAGAWCRWKIGQYATKWWGKSFPYGTLIANVLGCFLMGLIFAAIQKGGIPASPWHDLIAEGFLGALTTFSTFSFDTFKEFYDGNVGKGVANLLISLVVCILAVYTGIALVR